MPIIVAGARAARPAHQPGLAKKCELAKDGSMGVGGNFPAHASMVASIEPKLSPNHPLSADLLL
jgi:hypothetical protein